MSVAGSVEVARLFAKIGADSSEFGRALRKMDKDMNTAGRTLATFKAAVGTGVKIAAGVAATGLGALATAVATTGIKFDNMKQQAQIAFTTMLGSGDKAKAFLDDLQKFAAATPFEFPDLVMASQRLLAMGFAAEEIKPTLTAIGDAVAGLGGSSEMVNRVTLALGQMRAKGKVSAEEMLQLTEAGIPAWEMLAKKIGVDIPTAMKMSEKGAISADVAIGALVEGMNQKFGGLMANQSKTFGGLWSTIKDTFSQVSGRVMQPVFERLTWGFQQIVDWTSRPEFTQGVERFTKWIDYAAAETMVFGRNAIKFIGGLRPMFTGLGRVVATLARPFKEAFGGLFQALMVARGQGWSGVFDVLITRLMRAVNGFGKVLSEQAIPFLLEKLGDLGTAIKGWFTSIDWGEKLSGWAGALTDWAGGLWDKVSPYLSSFWGWLSGWFTDPTKRQTLWNAIVNGWNMLAQWAGALWNAVSPLLASFWGWLSGWFTDEGKRQTLWDAVVKGWDVVTDWAAALWGWVEPPLASFWGWLSGWFTDPAKRQALWDAVVKGWDIVTAWAQAIWGWAEPHLAAAWNAIRGWFDTPAERQAIWQKVKDAWTWVTDWAKAIWEWASPHLAAAWGWITGWVTDEQKRGQLWTAVKNTWTAITDWAGSVWAWAQPKLAEAWGWLTSWVTDPVKRQVLWDKLVATWTGFSDWAAGVWGKIEPALNVMLGNLKNWIDTNAPNLGAWIDAFVNITTTISTEWTRVWPEIQGIMTTAKDNITKDIGSILTSLQSLFDWVHGDGVGMGITWGGTFVTVANIVAHTAEAITHSVSSLLTSLNLLAQAVNAAKSGDWAAFPGIVGQFNAWMESQKGTVVEDLAKWMDPFYWLGVRPGQGPNDMPVQDWWKQITGQNPPASPTGRERATDWPPTRDGVPQGNIIERAMGGWARGLTWVGERGPELLDLPGGSYVHNAQDSARQAGSRLDIYLHDADRLPSNRGAIRELAAQLQRELQLSGARVLIP